MTVLLAMPCYGGQLHVGAARTLLRAQELGADTLILAGESAITRGRSNILPTFIKSGCDTLFMLDADCELDRDGLERLLKLDKPVRGAAVNLKTPDLRESLSCYIDDCRVRRAEMPDEPFNVDYLGGACLVVERVVIETLWRKHFHELYYRDAVVGDSVHLFHEIVDNGVLWTEDYAFCRRAREAGFSIWCDPLVKVRHWEGRMAWQH